MTTSASDAIAYNNGELVEPGVALAMETMAGYTAYFASEDPRYAHCGIVWYDVGGFWER